MLPQPGVIQADVRNLPLAAASVSNVVFDPPFLCGSQKDGVMKKRFGKYRTIKDLWSMYRQALGELYRILKPKGILVVKCQDTVDSGLNHFTHVQVMNDAVSVGFDAKDLFILTANRRLIQPNLKKQVHARKFHSYLWIFEKRIPFQRAKGSTGRN